MRATIFALVFGGCSFSATPSNSPTDAHGSDPPIDAASDGASLDTKLAPVCLGVFVELCVDPPPAAVTLMTQKLDTATSPLCVTHTATPAVDACVITGRSITIPVGNTVFVVGTKRLILLATDSITIAGVLDAASHRNASGPAADTGPCQTNFTNPTSGAQGGGGWGGSFGLPGNNGGNSAGSGIGGVAAAPGTASALTGGCAGGNGASNGIGGGSGALGHGGGAVLLIAAHTLTISGTVNASGAGASGGRVGGGGGGGGSGGMIVLDASTVKVPGRCFANGGGGAEGGSGRDGDDGGESSSPTSAARGRNNGAAGGGDGGDGGFGTTGAAPGGPGSNANVGQGGAGGGGGGGGGVGVIKVFSEDQQNTDDPTKLAPLPT